MNRNNSVDKALMDSEIPCRAREYISTESVEKPFPVTKNVTAKSSSEYVSAMKNPAKTPGAMYGKITLLNTFHWLAPKSRAASMSVGLISCNFGNTISTTIGILNAMCDTSTEIKPSFTPKIVKKIKNEAPMTTSGLTINTLFKLSKEFFCEWTRHVANRQCP